MKLHEADGEFVCGGEESCGFNAGQFVRDKDAQLASALLAECAAWAADSGKTLCDLLQDLYDKYGFWEETRFSLMKKGREGAEEIRSILKGLRSDPPKTLAGLPVAELIDYMVPEKTGLPAANVIQFITGEGDIISARPSGTEPKIRFYFSTKGPDARKKTMALRKHFGV